MYISEVQRYGVIDGDAARQADRVSSHRYSLSVQTAVGPKIVDGYGKEGRVAVAFSLNASGSLLGAHVVRSSGNAELDAKAVSLIGAAHFPVNPEGGTQTHVSIFTFR